MRPIRVLSTVLLLLVLLVGASPPAAAQCIPFICYFDAALGAFICPNGDVYPPGGLRADPVVNTRFNPDCDASQWRTGVIQVNVPEECSGACVWVEFEGEPEGWSLHITDSPTGNGFGGDAGSLPQGQNAEVQILNDELSVYSAADNPAASFGPRTSNASSSCPHLPWPRRIGPSTSA